MQLTSVRHAVAIPVLVALLLPVAAGGAILRTLKRGDRGEDVRELQQILNRDLETRVAPAGYGSPGHETDYFGTLTFQAVRKLQEKYARDILAPVGLLAPTGVVGPQTRLFLLRPPIGGEITTTQPTPQIPTPTPLPVPTPSPVGVKPAIVSITPAVITKSPEEVTITGSNFAPSGNTVFVASERPDAFTNLASGDGKMIRFTFRFATGERLKKDLTFARADGTYAALVDAISQNIKERMPGLTTARVPVRLVVRNRNGESNVAQLPVDITAILKSD